MAELTLVEEYPDLQIALNRGYTDELIEQVLGESGKSSQDIIISDNPGDSTVRFRDKLNFETWRQREKAQIYLAVSLRTDKPPDVAALSWAIPNPNDNDGFGVARPRIYWTYEYLKEKEGEKILMRDLARDFALFTGRSITASTVLANDIVY